jgi:NADPH:quinone reductase-like Zn-dependent oxidoreductase
VKAAIFDRYGGPGEVRVGELPRPSLAAAEVLVEVAACGMNPKDAWVRSGAFRLLTGGRFPKQTGSDFCGRVVRAGPRTDLPAGTMVFGYLNHLRGGAAAELLRVPSSWTAVVPSELDPLVAASLPCAYLTALQCLRDRAGLARGMRVMIYGGSGGVGTAATQLARHFGAHVTTVSSEKNVAYCREQGAHEALAYDADDDVLAGEARFDIVFKVFGGAPEALRQARKVLAPRGILVDLAANPLANAAGLLQRVLGLPSRASHIVRAVRTDLEQVARLALEGAIRPAIEVLPFEKAAEAHARMESAHTRGKLVLQVQVNR